MAERQREGTYQGEKVWSGDTIWSNALCHIAQGRFPFEDNVARTFTAAQHVLKNMPPLAPGYAEAPLLQ